MAFIIRKFFRVWLTADSDRNNLVQMTVIVHNHSIIKQST